MKKIQWADVAHFYIDAGILCQTPAGDGKLCTKGMLGLLGFGMNPGFREFEAKETKPFFRPMLDMTKEEAIEYVGLTEWHEHYNEIRVERNKFKDIIISWQGMEESRNEFNATGEIFLCFEQFVWLINKGFDVFNLIESGEAVNKL